METFNNYQNKKNRLSEFLIISFILLIVLIFSYTMINNFVFFRQRNLIINSSNISLKQKMLERNEYLFFNDYIDKDIYTDQQIKIVSELKEEFNNIIEICQNALNTKKKIFDILNKLNNNLIVTKGILSVRFIFIGLLKHSKTIVNFFKKLSFREKKDYYLNLDEKKANEKIKNVLSDFNETSSNLFFNGFIYSIFHLVGFNYSLFIQTK